MYHIDRTFFNSFHHVTRWKLLVCSIFDTKKNVKTQVILPKYIFFKEDLGIITEKIAIDLDVKGKYHKKHQNNMVDLYPPKLFQQALNCILKEKSLKHAFCCM